MIDRLSFVNSTWIWPVVGIAIVIWLVFAWKERHYIGSSKFIIHLVVAFLAVVSLALIALQPQIQIKKDSQVAAILTQDYNQQQLDSLKKANKNIQVYNYTVGEALFNQSKTPSSAFVLGSGIRSFDQWQLEHIPTTYLGGSEPKGVTQLNYNPYQTKGNRAQLYGKYNRPTNNNKLILEGPGGSAVDSITLTDRESQVFQVAANLNVAGNFIYYLVEKDSLGAVLTRDMLPLAVVEKTPLKILMLNGFPTFESKYLKNYLAETGHEVVVKNQLTRGRYKYEYFNMTGRTTVDISQEKLEPFDLLIIDNKSIRSLSSAQRTALKSAVSDFGLGILIQPDDTYFNGNKFVSSFEFDFENSKEVALTAFPNQNIKKYNYRFKANPSIQAIHSSDLKIWSGYQRLGAGRVGATVFRNTFELVLNGHLETYQSLWSNIIEKVSKSKSPSAAWNASTILAYKDAPFEFNLRTTLPNLEVESSEGYTVSLKRDVHVKSLWKGRVYPKEVGWKQHKVNQDSTTVFNYYVTDTAQWNALTIFNTIRSNQIRFNNKVSTDLASTTTLKLLNPLWFFVVFILCAGYLWLEPKL